MTTMLQMSRVLFAQLKDDLKEARKYKENETQTDHDLMLSIILSDLASPDDEYDDGPQDHELESFCLFLREKSEF